MNRQEAAGLILIGLVVGSWAIAFALGWLLGALIP